MFVCAYLYTAKIGRLGAAAGTLYVQTDIDVCKCMFVYTYPYMQQIQDAEVQRLGHGIHAHEYRLTDIYVCKCICMYTYLYIQEIQDV